MELRIIICKGLPGSGKSTWAKQLADNNQEYVRVNKDDIRKMIGYFNNREQLVIDIRDNIILEALERKKHVIVDDTNFHPKHEKRIRELAAIYNANVEVKFFDAPLDECIRRDARRPEPVGEKVIKKMYNEYLKVPFVRREKIAGLQLAIICDLDGTLCLHNGRSPYDVDKCDTDEINPAVQTILNDWHSTQEWPIIFVSGREEKYREKTEKWLEYHSIYKYQLFMRPTGDTRRDDIVKEEIFHHDIEPYYNVHYVLDDRNRVVEMWRRLGLTCLQVAEGDF